MINMSSKEKIYSFLFFMINMSSKEKIYSFLFFMINMSSKEKIRESTGTFRAYFANSGNLTTLFHATADVITKL
jgi:hypothetical protein